MGVKGQLREGTVDDSFFGEASQEHKGGPLHFWSKYHLVAGEDVQEKTRNRQSGFYRNWVDDELLLRIGQSVSSGL